MSQFMRPNSDVSLVSVTGSYTDIDETIYSDTDFLLGASSSNGSAEIGLSTISPPEIGTMTGRFRVWQSNNTNQRTLLVELLQGTTVKYSFNSGAAFNLNKGTATTYSFNLYTLSSGITDWSDVRVKFTVGGSVGAPARNYSYVYISWFEMETPDAEVFVNNIVLNIITNM